MFAKSIKDFFHNPIVTLPSIFISLIMSMMTSVLLNKDYLNTLESSNDIINYNQLPTQIAKFLSYLLLMLIFYFFISPLIKATTNFMICRITNGGKATLLESISLSPKYYIRLLCIMIFKLLVFIVITIVFILASIPSLISIYNNPEHMPILFLILIILLGLCYVVAVIALSPMEAILVHDDINFTEAIGKGLKFGFKNFLRLLGTGAIIFIVIIVINYITSIFIPDITAVSTFLTTIVDTFFTVYIVNLYEKKSTLN